ncbi:6-bladed beta-propeller [Puteibacter caeruleilacunae]|nr:6-bladed beta-propeller [Puteibacter caeruleilacunae]
MRVSLLILAVLLFGCSQVSENPKTTQEIQINRKCIKPFKLSEVVESIQLIPLESQEECFIREIRKLEHYNNRFYILDQAKVFVFDQEGKFLSQIGKQGNGPEEYSMVSDFWIDKGSGIIGLMDPNKKHILNYSITDGVYQSVEDIPVIGMRYCRLKDHQNMVYANNMPSVINDEEVNDNLFVSSSEGHLTKQMSPIVYKQAFSFDATNFVVDKSNDQILFLNSWCDTIYNVTSGNARPRYIVNYGDMSMPNSVRNERDWMKFDDARMRGNFAYGVDGFQSTENYLSFIFGIGKTMQSLLYNKKSGKVWASDKIENDLMGFQPKFPLRACQKNDVMIGTVEAYQLLQTWQNNPKYDLSKEYNLKEDSNVVLVLYKLKS